MSKRRLENRIDRLEDDVEGDLDDVALWRVFITGEHPRTGEPLDDETYAALAEKYQPDR